MFCGGGEIQHGAWIILRNFVCRECLARCLALDPEVLLIADMTQEAEQPQPSGEK
ncbi:MAG: hypothetical protein IJD43_06550 [Thermoguttaceae bacterium]|nr:hypothetical protein [Thermoguttaceae bacterium]